MAKAKSIMGSAKQLKNRAGKKSKLAALEKKALAIMRKLEATKKLYSQLEDVTLELERLGFDHGTKLYLFDNFSEKNVCFRPAAIRRFELREK